MDPVALVDRLPQPYRMIDKVLGALIESSISIALERQAAAEARERSRVKQVRKG